MKSEVSLALGPTQIQSSYPLLQAVYTYSDNEPLGEGTTCIGRLNSGAQKHADNMTISCCTKGPCSKAQRASLVATPKNTRLPATFRRILSLSVLMHNAVEVGGLQSQSPGKGHIPKLHLPEDGG